MGKKRQSNPKKGLEKWIRETNENDSFSRHSYRQEDQFLQWEENKLHFQKLEQELRTLKLGNENFKQDIELRRQHANKVFSFLIGWAIFVACILVMAATPWLRFSNAVLITLLGTTTLQIIGIYLIVANYIFPKQK